MAKPFKYALWGTAFIIVFAMSPLIAQVWISDHTALNRVASAPAPDIQGDLMVAPQEKAESASPTEPSTETGTGDTAVTDTVQPAKVVSSPASEDTSITETLTATSIEAEESSPSSEQSGASTPLEDTAADVIETTSVATSAPAVQEQQPVIPDEQPASLNNTESASVETEPSSSSMADAGSFVGRELDTGIVEVSFDELASYEYTDHSQFLDYDMSQHEVDGQIPANVKALNEREIVISGFMVPVDMDEGKITSFILTNSTLLCCYGVMPAMNEWMWVEMEEGMQSEFYNNIPVKVQGTIQVGEEIEDNIIISLYRMTATDVGLPHEL